MNNDLSEYADLWHKFKIEELGVFDKKECEQYIKLRKKIQSAIKLQELLIEELRLIDESMDSFEANQDRRLIQHTLKTLLEKSKQ